MVEIASSNDVRQMNRQRVLATVRRDGPSSRTDIGLRTGLSAATVSAITSDLLSEGVLSRQPSKTGTGQERQGTGRGRPQVALAINPSAAMVCAVYFQVNFISASMFDYAGSLISEYTIEISTKTITPDEIRQALIACIEGALDRTGLDSTAMRRIELGFQGVTDVKGEDILWTPICAQTNIPIKQWLEDHFDVVTHVANDCDMIAQALNWRDPKIYDENFATILLAHGVGMGLFLRGKLINGTRSSGVEFGHMTYTPDGALCRCGNRGCIEAYAGDYAISRRAKGQPETTEPSSVLGVLDLSWVLHAAKDGNKNAQAAIHAAGAAIGTGLASLYAIVDAFPVVLVGRGSLLIELMIPSIQKALETAPGESGNLHLDIECFPDERPMVKEGCAVRALLAQDDEMARTKRTNEAAE